MPLYHVSPTQFAIGQILQPGAWGRNMRQFQKNGRAVDNLGDFKNLVWESCLELARKCIAPNAPSRLDCVFACQTLGDANAFRARFRVGASVYEVEPVSIASPTFAGDYDLITIGGTEPFVDFWVDRSSRYWTTTPQGIVEVLVGGDVRVLGRVP